MIRGKEINTREMLMELGVPSFLATMAIPFMFFLPTTSDPDSPSIIEIIKGLQRGLRKLGHRSVRVNGIMDLNTIAALNLISPPRGSWQEKTWVQLYGDVIEARKNPIERGHQLMYENLSGYGPLPGYGRTVPGGLGGGTHAVAKTSPVSTTSFSIGWKPGKRPNNCVPTNSSVKASFRNLQRQVNRVGVSPRLSEDGIIGPGTIAGVRQAAAKIGQSSSAPSQCNQVASRVSSLTAMFRSYADRRGVSQNANKGSTSSPTSRAEFPALSMQGDTMEAVKKYAPFVALAGVAAWVFSRRRGSSKPVARPVAPSTEP